MKNVNNIPEEVINRFTQDMALELKPAVEELLQTSDLETTTFSDLECMALAARKKYGEILLEKVLQHSESVKKKL